MVRSGLSLFFFLIIIPIGISQCLEGDCQKGFGKFRFQNGAVYEGEMLYGRLNGTGKLIYSNGDLYIGEWKMNKREGNGKILTSNGITYEGSFLNNQLHGNIKVTDAAKGTFYGKWTHGKMTGTGTYTTSNGEVREGYWSDKGFVSGNQTIPSESIVNDCNLVPCNSGKGRLTLYDGSVYTGFFVNGLPHGEGECFFKNGDHYKGLWQNGKPQGQGRYTYDNGVVLSGLWDKGKYVDQAKIHKKSYAEGSNIYALIVGASRYDHFESLKYTDDDAYRIYAFLRSPEGGAVPDDHIRILIDESAVASNIYKGLDEIIAMAGPEDRVLVYLAGHGLQGFYVPTDSDGYHHRLDYDDIKERLSLCEAKQKLVIADACYSGSLLAAKTPIMESVDLFYKKLSDSGGGTAFLLSSKSEEYSLESQGLRQGIFSHYLIEGLKGNADQNADRMVNLDELYKYVYVKVRAYSGNLQSPILAGDIDVSMPLASVR